MQRHNTQKAGSPGVSVSFEVSVGKAGRWHHRERMRSEFTNTLRRSGTAGPVTLWSGFEGRRVRGGPRGEAGSALQLLAEEGIQKDVGITKAAMTLLEVKPGRAICIGSEGSNQRAKG